MSVSTIKKDVYNTGWTHDNPIASNFTKGEVEYRKIGEIVFLAVYAAGTSKTGLMNLYSMPVGYRPARRWTVPASYPNLSGDSYINIDTDGNVQFINQSGGEVSDLYFTVSYPVT